MIAQDAVRTRNVKNMLADDFEPKWGSYFTNIDTVFPYELKDEAFAQALAFFSDKVKLAPEELLLRVHSEDEELYQLVRESGWPAVEVDAHPEKYYRQRSALTAFTGKISILPFATNAPGNIPTSAISLFSVSRKAGGRCLWKSVSAIR